MTLDDFLNRVVSDSVNAVHYDDLDIAPATQEEIKEMIDSDPAILDAIAAVELINEFPGHPVAQELIEEFFMSIDELR